jgi:hypothetical protein
MGRAAPFTRRGSSAPSQVRACAAVLLARHGFFGSPSCPRRSQPTASALRMAKTTVRRSLKDRVRARQSRHQTLALKSSRFPGTRLPCGSALRSRSGPSPTRRRFAKPHSGRTCHRYPSQVDQRGKKPALTPTLRSVMSAQIQNRFVIEPPRASSIPFCAEGRPQAGPRESTVSAPPRFTSGPALGPSRMFGS